MGHVGLKGLLPACSGQHDHEAGNYLRATVRGSGRSGSRERPCRWQGYKQAEPQRVAQGLGDAGEEVTCVGREKRGSERLSAESEAWVYFLVMSVSQMSNARTAPYPLWGLQSRVAQPKESPKPLGSWPMGCAEILRTPSWT